MANSEDYRQTHIMTASPMELVLMLYDECIKSLNNAEKAFTDDGPDYIQDVNNNLLRAQNIITELTVSLDMEKGGDVALNLQRLYEFMTFHLSSANAKKAIKPIKDVKKMMEDLRESWQKIAEKESTHRPSQPPPSMGDNLLAAG